MTRLRRIYLRNENIMITDFDIYCLEDDVIIEPCDSKRTWMDALPERFGYRCLPMTLANSCGWVLKLPFTIHVEWNGGIHTQDLKITSDAPAQKISRFTMSHFGCGIITFHTGILIRTPPGIQVQVSGPPNLKHPGATALSAIVPTDWIPAPFTMNWKLDTPGKISFEAGHPFCFFQLVEPRLNTRAKPTLRSLEEDPSVMKSYSAWADSRRDFNNDLINGCPAALESGWQRSLVQAAKRSSLTAGQGVTKIRLRTPQVSKKLKKIRRELDSLK